MSRVRAPLAVGGVAHAHSLRGVRLIDHRGLADLEALEQCFQRGLLRCDDVPGQDCSQVEVCGEYAADWGACADPGKFLHCRDEKKTGGS